MKPVRRNEKMTKNMTKVRRPTVIGRGRLRRNKAVMHFKTL